MKYLNIIIIALYVVALIMIIIEFSGLWALATVLLMILLICSFQKTYFDKLFIEAKEQKNKIVEIVFTKLDSFSSAIMSAKIQMEQKVVLIENRLSDMDNYNKSELEKTSRELMRKIFDVENKLSVVKRSLGLMHEQFENRINRAESILNIKKEEDENQY